MLIDDETTLCDSSVICQYLEDKYPQNALYPAGIVERAQARWLEEFADTRMGEVPTPRHHADLTAADLGGQT